MTQTKIKDELKNQIEKNDLMKKLKLSRNKIN